MNEYLNYLAEKKANYYYELYKSNKRAERKDECLKRISMLDQYVLLIEIIDRLPVEMSTKVEQKYIKALDVLTVHNI